MRRIAVITVGRSDFGIYLPLLLAIDASESLSLQLVVGGMHLEERFGLTVGEIRKAGFEPVAEVPMSLREDTPESVARSMGLGVDGFAVAYGTLRPDMIVVLGDRFEMFSAVVAAKPFNIPIAHIHGGELTEGAMDDSFRHAMTKMSHCHFPSTETYGQRIVQMGEEPWRVHVVGALGIDSLRAVSLMSREELSSVLDLPPDERFILVTYHPVTLESGRTEWQVNQLLAALDRQACPVVFTGTNADMEGGVIEAKIKEYVSSHASARFFENLGTRAYASAMAVAAVMVGNSSSGIIEAATFSLPVVNIGTRQKGRTRGQNVIDVADDSAAIERGIARALSDEFRTSIQGMENPYFAVSAAEAITRVLTDMMIDDSLLMKTFHDMES